MSSTKLTEQSNARSVRSDSWICCQIGAREHYAVPRALASCGCEVRLLTDVWATPGHRWWMPSRWRQRWQSDIPSKLVTSWNLSALSLHSQLAARRLSLWKRISIADQWFQRKVKQVLPRVVDHGKSEPVVFAYSYAAKTVFETAKRLGCRTVLGQIDPGPVEMRLVQQLESKYGFRDSEWPVQKYWDDWKQECKMADAIVVNSEWSRTALLEEGVDASRIHVIPLAYEKSHVSSDIQHSCSAEFSGERPLRVLFLGQVNLRKGVKELAEAVRLLRDEPVEWTIVGGGDSILLDELRSLRGTIVTGPVSRHEVIEFYRGADVFLLPTHSDGFALTQLEAAAYGLPIIASQRCGDVVAHEENGLRLTDVSGRSIAASVRQLFDDPLLLVHMRRAQQHRPQLSLHDLGQQFVQLMSQKVETKVD